MFFRHKKKPMEIEDDVLAEALTVMTKTLTNESRALRKDIRDYRLDMIRGNEGTDGKTNFGRKS